VRTAPAVFHCIDVLLPSQYFASTASQGGLLAQPPLAIPPGTRLRGPAGTLRCSACRGRQNSALRASDRLPSCFLPTLRYSPA